MRRSPALQWSMLVAFVGVITVSVVVWGVVRPWSSIYDGLLFYVIVLPLAALTGLVLWKRDRFLVLPPRYRPLSVGLVGLLLCALPVLANQVVDLSFFWNRDRFEAAVAKLEPTILAKSEPSWVQLPSGLEYLAGDGSVVGMPRNGKPGWLLLFPESGEDFDGYFSAVVYLSPGADRQALELCATVSPLYPGSGTWYSCVVNRVQMPRR